jgi:hypothetical protein
MGRGQAARHGRNATAAGSLTGKLRAGCANFVFNKTTIRVGGTR